MEENILIKNNYNTEEAARIGIYVCQCGLTIAQTVDCPKVAESAAFLKVFQELKFETEVEIGQMKRVEISSGGNGAGRPVVFKTIGPVCKTGGRFDSPCPLQLKDNQLKALGTGTK